MGQKAFSLVELVVVILIIGILSVAVFTGGSAAIQKSRKARALSDMRNFQIAAELALGENPGVANIANNNLDFGTPLQKVVQSLNNALPPDYKLKSTTPLPTTDYGNYGISADMPNTGEYLVFESNKRDAWDNPYYIILDCADRHEGASDFFITVISAGQNSMAVIGGNIDSDDLMLVTQYSNGEITSRTFDVSEIGDVDTGVKELKVTGNSGAEFPAATNVGNTAFTTDMTITSAAIKPTGDSNDPWHTRDVEDYVVTINSSSGGTGTHAKHFTETGTEVILTAHPSNGWTFQKWDISGSYSVLSGSLTSGQVTILVHSNITVTPNFAR